MATGRRVRCEPARKGGQRSAHKGYSRRPPNEKYPNDLELAEDLAGSALPLSSGPALLFAGFESIHKLLVHGHTTHIGAGIAGALLGIIGNQVVARYRQIAGKRINSATLVADARHSWLDALSSAGALAGLVAVAFGQSCGDSVAGLAVTGFICHVGCEVTKDVVHRLADGIDPEVITTAEAAAGSVTEAIHAHARARWTGRTLRVEIEGWVDPDLPAQDAEAIGRLVADENLPAVAGGRQPYLDGPVSGSLTFPCCARLVRGRGQPDTRFRQRGRCTDRVSDDTDLLATSPWRGTPIIEPKAFAAKIDAMRRHSRRPRR